MCFSAPASFATSAVLTAVGAASLSASRSKRQRVISLIPFFFAIQQAAEGYQWLSLDQGLLSVAAGYTYFFFAFLFWPTFIPFTVIINEKRPKKILWWLLTAGTISTLLHLYRALVSPLEISTFQESIRYSLQAPTLFYVVSASLYMLAIGGSLLASSIRRVRIFGIIIIFSAIAAWLYSHNTFASVWCFFSALASALVYIHIRLGNRG